jgi:hypothetical protein
MSASGNVVRVEETTPIIRIKQAAKQVNDQHIEILVMGYVDRIAINVTMEGKIGHMVRGVVLPFLMRLDFCSPGKSASNTGFA